MTMMTIFSEMSVFYFLVNPGFFVYLKVLFPLFYLLEVSLGKLFELVCFLLFFNLTLGRNCRVLCPKVNQDFFIGICTINTMLMV